MGLSVESPPRLRLSAVSFTIFFLVRSYPSGWNYTHLYKCFFRCRNGSADARVGVVPFFFRIKAFFALSQIHFPESTRQSIGKPPPPLPNYFMFLFSPSWSPSISTLQRESVLRPRPLFSPPPRDFDFWTKELPDGIPQHNFESLSPAGWTVVVVHRPQVFPPQCLRPSSVAPLLSRPFIQVAF